MFEGILIDLQIGQHPQQALQEGDVDGVSTALPLYEQQQAVHRPRLY